MKYLETHYLDNEERKKYEEKGLFCYDLRHSDDSQEIASIEKSVLVNRCRSMITNEEIPLEDKYPANYKDYNEFIKDNECANSIDELLNNEPFKFYEISEIKKILKNKDRIVIVDDGYNELMIKYNDLPDFIVDVNRRIGMCDLTVYDYHNISMTPLLTTIGEFLNKCNPKVRNDIIDRLVQLQTNKIKCKNYKVMDEYTIQTAKEEIKQERNKKSKESR